MCFNLSYTYSTAFACLAHRLQFEEAKLTLTPKMENSVLLLAVPSQ